jgi:hypothetical protein
MRSAEDKAQVDADRAVPPAQVLRNIEVMRVPDDRYKMQAIQRFKLDPPVHRAIVVGGAKKNWLRH